MKNALKQSGLTQPQFSVVTMILAYAGISGAQLARLSFLTPQTMSVIVANLERDGMIIRRPHEEHGRIQIIELTHSGREVMDISKKAVQSVEAKLLSDLSSEEETVIRNGW
ncbi:MarR family winged helix-turn-helix transcriptional regulator [Klebsiella sp. RIT-PI-d]|uniref:MarR family winged helix-turn-helix transcriptional regulator n=1 Tax=Klebsiella sp. RIT-PI-d TaxID=1681196 RepID=UPI000AE6635A|nr:MarR family transcriptional regulator [Klebsiella sp. RIT-PI-d]